MKHALTSPTLGRYGWGMSENKFKQASHAIWEAMAPGWEEHHAYLEEAARSVTTRMLERLEPSPGDVILDEAAGTGVVGLSASGLVGPNGRVIISDFSSAMIDAASRRAEELGLENVAFQVLDAEQLDLPDDSVDGIFCRWGYMLMANPDAALAEAHRVLRGDGGVVCAVFAGPEQNPWAALPARVLQERGHIPPPEAGAPGILALSDEDRLRSLFTGAGFAEPTIEEAAFSFRYDDTDEYWEFLNGMAGAIAMVLGRLDEDERESVRDEVARRIEPFGSSSGIELPASSLVVSAS